MAVGPSDPSPDTFPAAPRKPADWPEIFRGFQLALDPRKLLVAAAGVLAMSAGWYLLSLLFMGLSSKPLPTDDAKYGPVIVGKSLGAKKANGTDYTEAEIKAAADAKFARDLTEWRTLNDLAGEGGRLRTMPWREYRGPNPVLILTRFAGGTAGDLSDGFKLLASGTIPVLIEPFSKLLLPVVKMLDPNANFSTRVYLLLCLLWSVAVWAFAGGVITRLAAVSLGGKDRVTLPEAVKFVTSRYLSYVLSPVVPIGIIAVVVVAMAIYGLVALIPILGDVVLYGLGMPLVFLGGIVMAILLVGLIGYPLMYSTISAEGSDTFDALSRSYNYVFQAPWSYLWYNLVSLLYGSLAVLFVVFLGSLTVYLGKFAVSQAPYSEGSGRNPDYLFIHAPESFGWRQLLLEGSPIAQTELNTLPRTKGFEDDLRSRTVYAPANADTYKSYTDAMEPWNWLGAAMTTFWTTLLLLLVIGFSYSYFWSAATIIYLLMRRKVDETDFDEIYAEDPLPDPVVPPPPASPVGSVDTVPGGTGLPVVPPPPVSVSPPPVPYTPPVPPAYTPPVVPTYTPPPPVEATVVPPNTTTVVTVATPPVVVDGPTLPASPPPLPLADEPHKPDEFTKDHGGA